jgi:branched-chain amino acid transport system substrate-binding protein
MRSPCVMLGAVGMLALLWLTACQVAAVARPRPMAIGLIAPLSGSAGAAGQAIQRGMLLAIDEVNQAGGVLGRPLVLVARDVPNDPAAGVAALRDLVERDAPVALFGGLYSEVMLAQLDAIHALRLPLINPWGSMAAVTQHGHTPSYTFRVSVSDVYADEFLVRYARQVVGVRRPGILADTSSWGEANVAGLLAWVQRLGLSPAGVERFDPGETNVSRQLVRLRAASADALLLVADAREGGAAVRGMAMLGWQVPVVSHWGITGGHFLTFAGMEHAENVLTLQTFSFAGDLTPKGAAVLRAYHQRFGTRYVEDSRAPVGVAHGYDGVHLLARAIRLAGSTDGPRVRDALEHLPAYDGLVKRYAPAFTPERHDALLAEDYMMAVWRHGRLVPAAQPRLER